MPVQAAENRPPAADKHALQDLLLSLRTSTANQKQKFAALIKIQPESS